MPYGGRGGGAPSRSANRWTAPVRRSRATPHKGVGVSPSGAWNSKSTIQMCANVVHAVGTSITLHHAAVATPDARDPRLHDRGTRVDRGCRTVPPATSARETRPAVQVLRTRLALAWPPTGSTSYAPTRRRPAPCARTRPRVRWDRAYAAATTRTHPVG